jgi:hypothetical protein
MRRMASRTLPASAVLLFLAACARTDAPAPVHPPAPATVAADSHRVDSAAMDQEPIDSAAMGDSSIAAAFADSTPPWPPDDSIREKVNAGDAVIAVTRDSTPGVGPFGQTFHVYVNGKEILTDSASLDVRLVAFRHGLYPTGVTAVLEISPGGTACGAMYRIYTTRDDGPPLLSPEVGNCNDLPALTWARNGLRLDFGSFAHAMMRDEPGFRMPPPERYELADSTLVRIVGDHREPVRLAPVGWASAPWSERMSRVTGRLVTEDGTLTVTRGATEGGYVDRDYTVSVDGKPIISDILAMVVNVYALVPPTASHGTLVVLAYEDGGNACEELYYVVEMRRGRPPRATDQFGTCSLARVLTTGGRLRVETGPYVTHWMMSEPGFRMPPGEAYEYRAGRMVRVPRSAAQIAEDRQ